MALEQARQLRRQSTRDQNRGDREKPWTACGYKTRGASAGRRKEWNVECASAMIQLIR